jgi:hypothetical protein
MGGRWDTKDPWDDAGDDDAWDDDWPSKRSGSGSSYQPRQQQSQARRNPSQERASYQQPYQSQARPYQQRYQPPQQQYQPYASANRFAVSARQQARGQAQAKRKDLAPVFGGMIALVAAVMLIGLLAHNQILALLHRTPATSGNTPSLVLPAFSDWRVAYAGQDGLLHAVSLDGKTDVTGVSLPALTPAAGTPTGGLGLSVGAAASADGHYLVYSSGGGAVMLHLTAQQADQDASRTGATVPSSLLWSPDGAHLAWLASNGAVHLTSVDTLADTATSGTATLGITELLGWVDATHLGVRVAKANATTEEVAVLDTASGQLRVVVTLTKPGYGALHYRLSPDGARVLAYNSPITGQPFTAIFRNYDVQSGQVHKLPNTLKAVGQSVSAVAWKPGAAMVAIASGSAATHDQKLWLVDATADSATSIGTTYPLGWLADGSTLITGNTNVAKAGGGPYTISAFTFPSSGAPTAATLTDKAMTFPWLGLVRTA